jgi:hypothetical protein
MSNREHNLPVPFTFQFNVTTSGTPERLQVKRRATTIAFAENTADADTITDSASGFLTAGFQSGDQITVAGSASNNGTYTIATVVAGTITLLARNDLTTEAAGATVTLTAPKVVPDGISLNIKAKSANTGNITIGYSSATALNTGTGWISLDDNESIGIQISSTDSIWLDATVTGEGVEVWFEKNLQA